MAEIISDNIYLVMLLPLWIFLIIMLGRFFSVYVNPKIAGGITLVSQLYGAAVCLGVLCKMPSDAVYDSVYPFIHINDFIIPLRHMLRMTSWGANSTSQFFGVML